MFETLYNASSDLKIIKTDEMIFSDKIKRRPKNVKIIVSANKTHAGCEKGAAKN